MAPGDPQDESVSKPQSTPSTESEAIVSEIIRRNGSGMLVAALVGAAIGAGVALILAPQSGQDSREWIARRTRGFKDRVGMAFEQSKDAVSNGVITL